MRSTHWINSNEQSIETIRSLGWTRAQRRDYRNYQPGMILIITNGKGKGNTWEVLAAEHNAGLRCRNKEGEEAFFTSDLAKKVDVCEENRINLAPGDLIMNRFGIRRTNAKEIINGKTHFLLFIAMRSVVLMSFKDFDVLFQMVIL